MSTDPGRRNSRWIALAIVLVLASGLAASPALATSCNSAGCFNASVEFLRIKGTGRIWIVVDNDSELGKLVPADNCVIKAQFYGGSSKSAIYVPIEDPLRDDKYAMLLTAFTTGAQVGFTVVADPQTGWCTLDQLDVQ